MTTLSKHSVDILHYLSKIFSQLNSPDALPTAEQLSETIKDQLAGKDLSSLMAHMLQKNAAATGPAFSQSEYALPVALHGAPMDATEPLSQQEGT